MVIDVNPFQYVLTRCIIGGKYNKWIVILQEFDLDFVSAKSKKSLVFVELMSDFPRQDEDTVYDDSFLMSTFSLSHLRTPSMDIFVYAIKPKTTSLSVTLCIVEGWILFFIIV
jgi:hypothetical protein